MHRMHQIIVHFNRSDFPVAGKVHSYAEPTIYQLQAIQSGQMDGSREVMSLRSDYFID